MKIIAWNINGIRAILKKNNLIDLINYENPDIFCLSETKISCPFDNIKDEMKKKLNENYNQYWCPCKIKRGYSGTCVFSKIEPIKINNEFDDEGRVIICYYKKFILVHVYTPNSGEALKRLNYRVEEWDIKFKEVERFEPHGYDHPSGFNYNQNLLDFNLSNISNNFNFT